MPSALTQPRQRTYSLVRENQKCCYNSGIGVYIRNVLNAVRLLCNEDYRDPFITLGSCKCENESNPFIEIEAMHRGRTGSSNKGCAGAQIVGAQGSHRGSNSGHAGDAQGLRRGSNSGCKRACAVIQTGLKRGMRRGSNGTRRGHVGLKQGLHTGDTQGLKRGLKRATQGLKQAQMGHAGAQTGDTQGFKQGQNQS